MQFNAVQFIEMQFNAVQFNVVQFNVVQFNVVQFQALQRNACSLQGVAVCSLQSARVETPPARAISQHDEVYRITKK